MSHTTPTGGGFVTESEPRTTYTSGRKRSQAEEYYFTHNAEPLPEPPEVLVYARTATEEERSTCAPINALERACEAAGWESKMGYYSWKEHGVEFKTGQRAGQMREDKIGEGLTLIARKAGKENIKVNYERVNGGKWTCTYRYRNDAGWIKALSDKEMKEYVKT
jgi:hypothetical protein